MRSVFQGLELFGRGVNGGRFRGLSVGGAGQTPDQPARHGFFFFPEEPELSEQGAKDQEEELVEGKNAEQVDDGFDPERSFRLYAEQVKNRPAHLRDGETGEGEDQHDCPELPGAGNAPLLFEAGHHN